MRTTTLAELLLGSAEFEAFLAWASKVSVTVQDEAIPLPEVSESTLGDFHEAQK